jgi:hypothetical protein
VGEGAADVPERRGGGVPFGDAVGVVFGDAVEVAVAVGVGLGGNTASCGSVLGGATTTPTTSSRLKCTNGVT